MKRTSIPLTILTGFLGSGKTTLLNGLLRDDRLRNAAVIVNEFGEIGLDHLLVESALDQMMLLDNGCLCCTVRGDLVDTLDELLRRAEAGDIPAFEHVIIETTGLADPGPIVQTLASQKRVAEHFHLHGVVATIDGLNGVETFERFAEARAQTATADLLLVTKADRSDANVAAIRNVLRSLNPTASVALVHGGQIDPAVILSVERSGWEVSEHDPECVRCDHPAHSHSEGAHGHAASHGWDIQSVSMLLDEDVSWDLLREWLEWMLSLRGADLLRVKGIVKPAGFTNPVLVHGVQHVFFPVEHLVDWPSEDRRNRLVLIARDIPAQALKASFKRFQANRLALERPITSAA